MADSVVGTYADDLPHEPEHEVFSSFVEVVRTDVGDVTADRLCRANGERQVLVALVDAQTSSRLARLVDRLLVDRLFLREVYQLATSTHHIHTARLVALLEPEKGSPTLPNSNVMVATS